ncbi:hypothetical protein ACP4OV_031707 [Aristida adscensionis]
MDPNMKKLLEGMKGMSQALLGMEKSLSECISGVEHYLGVRFQAMEDAAAVFEGWKPQIDAAVEDLKLEVGLLRKHANRVVFEQSASASGVLIKTEVTSASASARRRRPRVRIGRADQHGGRASLVGREQLRRRRPRARGSAPLCSAPRPDRRRRHGGPLLQG